MRQSSIDWGDTNTWTPQTIRAVNTCLEDAKKVEGNVIQYTPLEVKLDGGVVLACNPRMVTVDDVAAEAKRNCRTCGGNGVITVTQKQKTDVKGRFEIRKIRATCGCANKRFHRKNPNVLVDKLRDEWVLLEDIRVTYVDP